MKGHLKLILLYGLSVITHAGLLVQVVKIGQGNIGSPP